MSSIVVWLDSTPPWENNIFLFFCEIGHPIFCGLFPQLGDVKASVYFLWQKLELIFIPAVLLLVPAYCFLCLLYYSLRLSIASSSFHCICCMQYRCCIPVSAVSKMEWLACSGLLLIWHAISRLSMRCHSCFRLGALCAQSIIMPKWDRSRLVFLFFCHQLLNLRISSISEA